MDKAVLEAKRTDVESRFNSLTQQKNDLDAELVRLQGEHRVYDDLIASLDVTPSEPVEAQPAEEPSQEAEPTEQPSDQPQE
jgi:peptidoglycan hydrolase CwlO-like protein